MVKATKTSNPQKNTICHLKRKSSWGCMTHPPNDF
jgi:hypothetical protein